MITEAKVRGAERWAARFGAWGIFASRLLPVVRHLIGIPAGIVKMDFKLYSMYTLIGSALWSGYLCYVGIKMGENEQLMAGNVHAISAYGAAARWRCWERSTISWFTGVHGVATSVIEWEPG